MFAIRIELCMSNILVDFTPLSSRGKRRRRLAAQAAEPCGNVALAHIFKQVYVGNPSLPEMNFCRKGSPSFSSSAIAKKTGFTRPFCDGGGGGIRKEREARRNSEDVRRKECGAEISSRCRGSTTDVRGATLPPNNSRQPRVAKPSSPAMENPTLRVGFCWRSLSNVNRIFIRIHL